MSGLTAADFAEGEWASGMVDGERRPLRRLRTYTCTDHAWEDTDGRLADHAVTDLRRAVWVDPDHPISEAVVEAYVAGFDTSSAVLVGSLDTDRLSGLRAALPAWIDEQAPKPDPATVWTDGDVVQDTENLGVAWRDKGAWCTRSIPAYAEDAEIAEMVESGTLRILRRASLGIGCGDPS